jgi:mRNA interferase MazF
VKGDVVVVPFPFSDLSRAKRRPALVAASPSGDDLILCQITSQAVRDGYALALSDSDFREGSLKQPSNIRPNRIFTADKRLILYRVGALKQEKLQEVAQAIVQLFRE